MNEKNSWKMAYLFCIAVTITANHANVTDQAHEALGIFVLLQHDAGFFDVNLTVVKGQNHKFHNSNSNV